MSGARAVYRFALLALAAAALLSACVVEVEGARCRVSGEATDCPDGQACGNDLRCSVRAHLCAALAPGTPGSWCTPGEGGACLDPDGNPTTGPVARAYRCTADDPVCGTWIVDPCPASGLACAVRKPRSTNVAGAWCVCPDQPAGSRELLVRPGGSLRAEPPFATGAASPLACGFLRLFDALAEADAITTAAPSAVATVTAIGAGADPVTFTSISGSAHPEAENFPLEIKSRVILRSDAPSSGGTYQIVFDGEGLPSAPVVLHSGGAFAGFTIQNGSGGHSNDAIALACDGPDPVLLTSVVLDGQRVGGSQLGRGVAAGAGCSLVARDLTVRNMSAAGVSLDAELTDPAPVVSVSGGTITGCGNGVFARFGHVVLQSLRIEKNTGIGVRANAELSGFPRVEIRNSKVVGNGDTGIVVGNASEVRITGTTSSGNDAATAWGGFPLSASRKAGGIVLIGNPPLGAVEFARNRIYGNGGDQVLVVGAATTWNLDGPSSCGSDASGPLYSMIGCYDPTFAGTTLSYRGIVAVNANVSAQYVGWQAITPSPNDVAGISGTVTLGVPCLGDVNLCSKPP